MALKRGGFAYIYQKNKKKGVIMDIQTFNALLEMLEDYEDAEDFEVLKTEETIDDEDYRKSRLKQDVRLRKHFDVRVVDFVSKKIKVINPVGYLEMLVLEKNVKKILTDSGGIQNEAYIFKVPCVTLRETTEWIETVEDGWNVLVGENKETILRMANDFEPKGEQRDVFGGGDASKNC
jgi:UDP-GlcNAc3NAcA epimerase